MSNTSAIFAQTRYHPSYHQITSSNRYKPQSFFLEFLSLWVHISGNLTPKALEGPFRSLTKQDQVCRYNTFRFGDMEGVSLVIRRGRDHGY